MKLVEDRTQVRAANRLAALAGRVATSHHQDLCSSLLNPVIGSYIAPSRVKVGDR